METNITKINVGGTLLPVNDPNVCDNFEDGNTASKTYNAGEFLIWKGSLYKVTTTIAQGATFTDGVNLEDATITELLEAVNESLSGERITLSNPSPAGYGTPTFFAFKQGKVVFLEMHTTLLQNKPTLSEVFGLPLGMTPATDASGNTINQNINMAISRQGTGTIESNVGNWAQGTDNRYYCKTLAGLQTDDYIVIKGFIVIQ